MSHRIKGDEKMTQLRRAEIPDIVLIISFGRVIWMLEKAGCSPLRSRCSFRAILRCAGNIARRWIWEHHERWPSDRGMSFPGDSSLHQAMMPTARRVGEHKYFGVWLHGGELGPFMEREFLGDDRMATLSEAARAYGSEHDGGRAPSPPWYRSNFVHWAITFIHFWSRFRGDFVLERSQPGEDTAWCGVEGCPYPYVTAFQVAPVPFRRLDPNAARETRETEGNLRRSTRPHWSTFIYGDGLAAMNTRRNVDEGATEDVWGGEN